MDFIVFEELEITNICGELQTVSGKFQKNALNNIQQISTNDVII